MYQALQFAPVDVVELVFGNNFDVGEQKCRVIASIGDAARDRLAGHPDLVDQLPVLVHIGVSRFAAEHIDGPARQVIRFGDIAKQRTGAEFGDPACRIIPVKCLLE